VKTTQEAKLTIDDSILIRPKNNSVIEPKLRRRLQQAIYDPEDIYDHLTRPNQTKAEIREVYLLLL
jgi:hypothetical protein